MMLITLFGYIYSYNSLIEEPKDFSSNMLPSRLFMIHNASTCSKNDISNASSRQQLIHPLLQIRKTNVESWGDDTTFVESAVELDDDLSRSVVIDFLKFANVA
jgi:hypothetical protein